MIGNTPHLKQLLQPARLLVALAFLVAAVPATAQTDLDPAAIRDRIERELERTNDLLERVGPRIRESNHPRALELLKHAIDLQEKAIAGLEAAEDVSNPLVARNLAQAILSQTLRARELANRAAQIAHEEVSLQERASRVIEQANAVWERLSDLASDANDDRAHAILKEAHRQIESAQRHFADYQFEIALRLGESALHLMDPLRNAAGTDVRPERLEQQLERLRDLLDRAQSHRDQMNDMQLRRLDQGTDLMQRAVQNFQDGNYAIAHRLAQRVQNLLRELRSQGPRTITEADVQRGLDRFDAEAARLREALEDQGGEPEEAARLLQRALDARDGALESSANEQYQEALTRLRAALDTLSRARRLLGSR